MTVKQSEWVSYFIRTAVAVVLGTSAMLASAPPALAADASGPPGPSTANDNASVLEEITVTGTRIRRKDLESISPLVTIDSDLIEQRAGLNLESYLNQLPQYNPAQTPTTENEDVQPSAVNTVGISTISLRGFGPNRSLVLVDGHRTTPVNALMVTDVNSIPSSMIDHVEIITGGASAVYGADAIGGVTNFILKKNYQGAQVDVQDGMTQAGDGNELRVSAIMGTTIGDNRGNLISGVEYYDRNAAYQRNRNFYTNAWTDPNAPQTAANALFVQGYNAYDTGVAAGPSAAALNTLFAQRAAAGGGVYGFGSGGAIQNLYFNPNGSLFTLNGPLSTSNYMGPTASNGYGPVNAYDSTMPNSASTPPNEIQQLKWNNTLATVSSPQTRYSFFANGTYDITDKIQFYTNARFADSQTTTLLDTPTSAIFGWEANVPYNAKTDSPINPALITSATSQATLSAIAASFAANPTSSNPNWNPNFIALGTKGAQHPVPWQLALALDSRGATPGGVPSLAFTGNPLLGASPACFPQLSASLCSNGNSSWQLWYLPQLGAAPQRSTVDTSQSWQIETGLRFPLLVSDWTGEVYYSRGQSLNYENAYGNDSLQRFRAVIQSPGYGAGQSFQGNANGANANFGTSVPTNCTSGFYGSIFAGTATSADCQNAVGSVLQTLTAMQQDIVEVNFQGTLFNLPAGEVSAAAGYQYRRDSGQFNPDGLQATNSFLDQTVGLYPLGTLQSQQISAKDGYAEIYVPLLQDLPFLKKLNLDIGGRYSSYSVTTNSTTFKVDVDASITNSFRIRGGYNRATRAPNLGELYLGAQEYFGGGAQFGDPCSVRSNAPFGAGGAAADTSPSAGAGATKTASGQSAAGALSTYLICQAQMGTAATTQYYTTTNQGTQAAAAVFAWLNEEGNPSLRSETADSWTAGFVINHVSDNPWLSGLSGSVDWWQTSIKNAIELDSPDYANFLCYGGVTVTNAAQAAAQAATPACQNVGRSQATGLPTTTLLQYTNQAAIATAGVDLQLNWMAQLADLGLRGVPGAITFNTQDSLLDYYRTKNSPAAFDVNTNWKGSMGPNLVGTNGGAYSFRLFSSIGWVMPSFGINLRWRFLPSINSANHAAQQAIIDNDNRVAATGKGTMLSYIPNTDLAAPAWSAFDLSGSWNINKVIAIRGGINNLLNKEPPIAPNPLGSGATAGYPVGTNLNAVCSAAAAAKGCVNPSAYSLPNDGHGQTSAGFYDVYGRTFFLGVTARF